MTNRAVGRAAEYAQSATLIWVFVFFHTVLAGVLLQLVLLPHVFPALHAGNGLFKGLDGPKFDRFAMDQYEAIIEQGWRAWEPKPQRQFVSGVASAVYVLMYPRPWALLPLNAALNATAAVCMVWLLRRVTGDERRAAWAALPFVFFPSSLLWNAQLHNENYAVPGVCMLLLGWSRLVGGSREDRPHRLWGPLGLIAVGSLLVGAVRIYIVGLMLGLFLLAGFVLVAVAVWGSIRSRAGGQAALSQAGAVLLAALTMGAVLSVLYSRAQETAHLQEFVDEVTEARPTRVRVQGPSASATWRPSAWLPSLIDNRFRDLARMRRLYTRVWEDSGSVIDADVELESSAEVLAYLPRALQISLFSPFPSIWFTPGNKVTGAAFRAAVVPETLVAYACLLGLPLASWARRRTPALWVVLSACTGMLLIYGIVAPNQGTIFRFRFPYYLPLVCLGLWGWLETARRQQSTLQPSR